MKKLFERSVSTVKTADSIDGIEGVPVSDYTKALST